MKKILLQTTIPHTRDDWSIARFSLLKEFLSSIEESNGRVYEVVARDRESDASGDDPILSRLDESDFQQLWLFGVDVGNGLTAKDREGIRRFHQRGGGLLTSRDHQDLGISMAALEFIGRANYFHSSNCETDAKRDDTETMSIDFPNYHTGRNGDYQIISAAQPLHPIMRSPRSGSGRIEFLPAHPHEGNVCNPPGSNGVIVAVGTSKLSGRKFNLAVAFDRAPGQSEKRLGRFVADSSFHHFLDYNWDPSYGCPSFVTEPVGGAMSTEPRAISDTKQYVANIAAWLT